MPDVKPGDRVRVSQDCTFELTVGGEQAAGKTGTVVQVILPQTGVSSRSFPVSVLLDNHNTPVAFAFEEVEVVENSGSQAQPGEAQ